MKKILIFILILFCCKVYSQDKLRVGVDGSIQMPAEDEARGVSVFNLNTNRGTVSNDAGEFRLNVGVNDSIRISAVQFQGFTVVINEGVINSRQLNINVTEVVNELPEVIVSPYDLTGNVQVDIARLPVVNIPDTLNGMQVQNMYFEADAAPNTQDAPYNTALATYQTRLVNGLNFVNLFKALLISSRQEQVQQPSASLEMDVRELYGDEFFKENLNIEIENINEFIYYADENGLEEHMLRKGNELELIDFLVEQSKKYKRQRGRK
ncbi:carboxypeptidase-like regulatory domain-containing protein [Antarcticibacterium sp. 1MA-6-2]|uniref:carboxypeptidase-like regulatory domain-containing protein n=1 Tax=Antarcticibacterium sp. 1MA-6-2 TaxID=2908210 RepID=UPI001F2B44EF|nr:carboxypeptidase-like regulatory domain-containing protein [Antarcticibacterium sp. 1MA-6-2]UJH91090.1 carboxypeptidase-like regulatory domain-containing protein [Antarcticibacterium sp. 1MA-6-2]